MSDMDSMDDELLFADEDQPAVTGGVDDGSFSDCMDKESQECGWKVLLVDDETSVHDVTKMALRRFNFDQRGISFLHAYSGAEAKEIMESNPDTALVLLDVVMESDHAGLEVVNYIRNQLKNGETRIVLRTGQPGQAPEESVIVEYDINDYKNKTELTSTRLVTTVISALRAYKYIRLLDKNRKELQQTQENVISMLGTVAEFRSEETSNHVVRVGRYVARLAELYGLENDEIRLLASAAELHDMGKIGIPDVILNKPGKFTDEEMEVMRGHARIGRDILNKNSDRPVIHIASIIAHQHHEHWNGNGYPMQLKGEEIHLYARMTAIADVFDALGSNRCYKCAWEIDDIKGIFEEEKGSQFDPHLTGLFLDHFDDFVGIHQSLQD